MEIKQTIASLIAKMRKAKLQDKKGNILVCHERERAWFIGAEFDENWLLMSFNIEKKPKGETLTKLYDLASDFLEILGAPKQKPSE